MTPKQCTVARALLGLSRDALATKTKGAVSPRTLDDFEAGKREPRDATLTALRAVFARARISFDQDGVNARLERRLRARKKR